MPNFTSSKQSASRPSAGPAQLDEKHLAGMIAKLHDPLVASIFLEVLNQYPELETRYLGSYLKAIETVERTQSRNAKARAIGQACKALRVSAAKASLWVYRSLTFCVARLREHMKQSKSVRPKAKPAANDNVIYLPDASKATGTDY